MSLGILIKSPEGIVLAAESRVTLTIPTVVPGVPPQVQVMFSNFDNATKILSFNKPHKHIGVVTYGQATIGAGGNNRTAQSFIPEFEALLKDEAIARGETSENQKVLLVSEFTDKLKAFFTKQWNDAGMPAMVPQPMSFNVAGFDDGEPYGKIYTFNVPDNAAPIEIAPKTGEQYNFAINWGGQREIVDRLVLGYDRRMEDILSQSNIGQDKINEIRAKMSALNLQIPIPVMALQDCVTLAILFIKTTIEMQTLTVGLRGCGGPIDVAIIKRGKPLEFIQQKHIVGEYPYSAPPIILGE